MYRHLSPHVASYADPYDRFGGMPFPTPRRRNMHLLVATFTLTASLACEAQTFLQGTVYGDSIEQVQSKVPGARAPRVSDELKANGIAALISAPIKLVEQDFESYYYFSPKGLERVILRRTQLSSEAEAEAVHNALIEALRLKYGRVAQTETIERVVLEKRPMWAIWNSGDTDILLVPQHGTEVLSLAYTLSERSKERANARAADTYKKKVKPKAEAAKL